MKVDLHFGIVLGLFSVSLGCRLGQPPLRKPAPSVSFPGGRSAFVAPRLVRNEDLFGPASIARVSTSSGALDGSAMAELLEEGEELEFSVSDSVRPILAVTGTVTFDLPMSEDERVEYWVEFLRTRGRRSFSRWLARSTRYVPLFWRILDEHGLPRDLVFLSMIESGFSPRAYSWAHASGPWQFMPYTGRRFGLEVGFWVDERRDFEKATHAAARYLSRLYEMFGEDWWLAMAAYNAGPGKVRRAIRGAGTSDFWRISRTFRLRRETKQYVPKLLAAARIAKEPRRYGFDEIAYQAPLEWEVLSVTVATDLETLAGACGLETSDELGALNPELRCAVTPPLQVYPLRVPKGRAQACREGLMALNPALRMTYRYALLSEGEKMDALAERFRTSAEAIARFNRIDNEQLAGLAELVVPVPLLEARKVPVVTPDPKAFRPGVYRPDGQQLIVHRVRSGDSLWRIARRYRVSLRKLRLWNGLWRSNALRVGQRIKVFLRGGGRRTEQRTKLPRKPRKYPLSHVVRSGESPWSIATKYGLTVRDLLQRNGLRTGVVLQPGQRLEIQ